MLRLKALVASLAAAAAFVPAAHAQEPIKVGVVTFLSGPAAGPFGVPARNAAEIMIEMMNGGKVAAPYDQKGFGGAPMQMVLIDEAGSTTTQVTEFRNLVQRSNVDVVIGYISSGNCLAIAPVAEELKKLTNFFDCGTPRIFEDGSYKYVFRTSPHSHQRQRRRGAVHQGGQAEGEDHCRHQPELRLGPGLLGGLRGAMKQLVPGVEDHDVADAQAVRGPVRRRDLGAARRPTRTRSTPASGTATSRRSSCRRRRAACSRRAPGY